MQKKKKQTKKTKTKELIHCNCEESTNSLPRENDRQDRVPKGVSVSGLVSHTRETPLGISVLLRGMLI